MRIFLPKSAIFTVIFLFYFSINGNSQCTITGALVNASTYSPNPCVLLTGCNGILYIGDGISATSLVMNAAFNLTCLGPVQLIVRDKAAIDFSPGNDRLTLAVGSSITFEGTGTLIGGSCNASERIYIGTNLLASCNGSAGAEYSFPELIGAGGYSPVSVTPLTASVCGSGSFSFTATATPSSGATYKWYTASSGGLPIYIGNTYSTGIVLLTTTYYVEASYSTYTTVRKAVTVAVNPLPSVPTITAGSLTTFCSGASVTLTSSSGVSYLWSTGATTASISVTTTGNYTVQVTNAGGCQSVPSVATAVTVLPVPVAPVIVITQPTCETVTGSAVLSGLPASGTLVQTGSVAASYPITGTTMTIQGLAVGSYSFTASNSSGCSSLAPVNGIISSLVTNTWNGIAWSNGIAPTINQNIVFDGDLLSTSDIAGCSCLVKAGRNVTINSLHTLTLGNGLTIEDQANPKGILTFEDSASLVQTNDVAVNSGSIIYKRKSSPTKDFDFVYWSSPVLGQKLNVLSPNTLSDKYYSLANNNWVSESGNISMIPAKGYIIRVPRGGLWPNGENVVFPYKQPVQFVGVPNNGSQTFATDVAGNFNLIGNPYPSALNADTFLDANSAILDGTIYLWTHNTAIQLASTATNGGSGAYVYTSDDYAAYNKVGGVAAASDPDTVNGIKPTGKIAAGQSFMIMSNAKGTVNFNNSMRVSGGVLGINNSQFFRIKSVSKASIAQVEKDRVWLNLTNDQGAFKQILVGYITGATNGYENSFDGESLGGNQYVDFYSVNQNKNLTIQGRALPFDKLDEVPLGYSSTIKGVFSIGIDQVDGLLASQDIFLEDKLTKVVKNLKEGKYSFDTAVGTFNSRFVLRYENKTLAVNDSKNIKDSVLVSNKNKEITINSSVDRIDKVQVYDLLGRQIFKKMNVDNNELKTTNLGLDGQILLVTVTLQNGKMLTKKMLF